MHSCLCQLIIEFLILTHICFLSQNARRSDRKLILQYIVNSGCYEDRLIVTTPELHTVLVRSLHTPMVTNRTSLAFKDASETNAFSKARTGHMFQISLSYPHIESMDKHHLAICYMTIQQKCSGIILAVFNISLFHSLNLSADLSLLIFNKSCVHSVCFLDINPSKANLNVYIASLLCWNTDIC